MICFLDFKIFKKYFGYDYLDFIILNSKTFKKCLNGKIRLVHITRKAGLREVGKKDGRYREYLDVTSPLPWWRQMHDSRLFHESRPDVYIGGMENMEPYVKNSPIFDDGYFWEDRSELAHEYLEKYFIKNEEILNDPKLYHNNA